MFPNYIISYLSYFKWNIIEISIFDDESENYFISATKIINHFIFHDLKHNKFHLILSDDIFEL
jgi:hypothetical protein